jgi:hypothetical protein
VATIQGKRAFGLRVSLLAASQYVNRRTSLCDCFLIQTAAHGKQSLSLHRTLLAAVIITTFVSGCAIADFTTYSGQQQNSPMQPGSFVATQYAIPA